MTSLLIDPANAPSIALAARARYAPSGEIGDQLYFRRDIPPLATPTVLSRSVHSVRTISSGTLTRVAGAAADEEVTA